MYVIKVTSMSDLKVKYTFSDIKSYTHFIIHAASF